MPPLARLRTSVSSSSKVPSAFGTAVLAGSGFLERDLVVLFHVQLMQAPQVLAEDALAVEGLEPEG